MRHPLIPRGKGRRIGRKHPSSFSLGSGRASYVSSQRGPGRSPGRKWFYCNLISADRFCWQQILHLFVLKSGGTVPLSPKSGGTVTPMPVTVYLGLWPLTLKLVRIIARGVSNLITNFGVSRSFRSRPIGQHLSDASRNLVTLTFDLECHGACRW